MNSKGFTLVELVVAIGLLALLGTIIASNMVGMQSRQLAANYEAYKEQLENAACFFLDSKYLSYGDAVYKLGNEYVIKKEECMESECYISAVSLINYGFIDKDLENPATGLSVAGDELIKIYFDAGVKTCKYSTEL